MITEDLGTLYTIPPYSSFNRGGGGGGGGVFQPNLRPRKHWHAITDPQGAHRWALDRQGEERIEYPEWLVTITWLQNQDKVCESTRVHPNVPGLSHNEIYAYNNKHSLRSNTKGDGKTNRLTHKIAIQLHLVPESCTICSSRTRPPVWKLLDTPSYRTPRICRWLL
jgi:hypothetical protein